MGKTGVTERDKRLFRMLSLCGVMKPDQARIVYGNHSVYHVRRVAKLVTAGYLARNRGYIRVTPKGLRMAGVEEKPLRVERHRFEEHSIAVGLMGDLPGWDCQFSIELKRQESIPLQSRLYLIISRNDLKYGVYILSDMPRRSTVNRIKKEMSDIRKSNKAGIDRLLIFCSSQEIVDAFGTEIPSGYKEICLLPYPQGVDRFKILFDQAFHSFLKDRFPGLKPSSRPCAHFEYRDAFITVMIHNDLVSQNSLKAYLEYVQKREGRRCIAICAPGQTFPGVEVIHYAQQIQNAQS